MEEAIDRDGDLLPSTISTGIEATAAGNRNSNGGNINIRAGAIDIRNGSFIESASFGQGNAGNVSIVAETVEIAGSSPLRDPDANLAVTAGLPSAILTNTAGSGRGGELTIDADSFRITDGAILDARSEGDGPGGTVTLRVDRFAATNGGQLVTTALGAGNGGNILLEVADSALFSGSDATFFDRVAAFPELEIDFPNEITETGPASGLYANAIAASSGNAGRIDIRGGEATFTEGAVALSSSDGTGNAGNLIIVGDRLNIVNSAQLSVSSSQTGQAGNLEVTVDRLQLDNGILSANTFAGDRGNIVLQTQNLQLRQGSAINANALGLSTGGNITINTETLVALENSDITANAEQAFGGRVAIDATAIFGTEFRPFETSQSDITATSALGAEFSGIVEINTPDIDSPSGLLESGTETIDTTGLDFDDCREYAGSGVYYTGRGGIPENPRQFLEIQTIVDDLGELVPFQDDGEQENTQLPITYSPLPREATTWTIAPDGQISLISQVPTNAILPQPDCHSERDRS